MAPNPYPGAAGSKYFLPSSTPDTERSSTEILEAAPPLRSPALTPSTSSNFYASSDPLISESQLSRPLQPDKLHVLRSSCAESRWRLRQPVDVADRIAHRYRNAMRSSIVRDGGLRFAACLHACDGRWVRSTSSIRITRSGPTSCLRNSAVLLRPPHTCTLRPSLIKPRTM